MTRVIAARKMKFSIKDFFSKCELICSQIWSQTLKKSLTPQCVILKNGQKNYKNFSVFIPQDFKSLFGHFSTLGIKKLTENLIFWKVEEGKIWCRKKKTP